MKEGGENQRDYHSRQVIDNIRESFFVEKVQDTGMYLGNGGLHSYRIDGGNISRAETGVDETNSMVNLEEMA